LAKSGARTAVAIAASVGSLALAVVFTAGPADAQTASQTLPLSPTLDRQERWRAARGKRLELPLPGTPDTTRPLTRLNAAGLQLGAPILIRIFKAESELEVWVKKRTTYALFATYPVCYWSGVLGPKLREGDKQTPEGFYALSESALHHGDRWRRSLNIGYPNAFDRTNGRSGSNILVHGGCDSVGCFAMTDPVNAELYDLVSAALRTSAEYIPLHVFPFRMTDAKLAATPAGRWKEFWDDLKSGYDSFERTRMPPNISVCGRRYQVRDNSPFTRNSAAVELCAEDRKAFPQVQEAAVKPERRAKNANRALAPAPRCNGALASCRKWAALRDRRAASRLVAGQSSSTRNKRSAVR
jgi:murein L,D-transpeptidase YafK